MKKETQTLSRSTLMSARRWHCIDAQGKTVGRLASVIAGMLRGKLNPAFSAHLDGGDFVVVVNAQHVRFSGEKLHEKVYYRHTEYPGGIRMTSAEQMLKTRPERVLEKAVAGMLPKTPLGRHLLKKLKVYPGADHPHKAQRPAVYTLGE
jgi:large subunit ribosomal protein L13